MKKIIAAVSIFALCISTITTASASLIATNPTPDLYYLGKTYATYDEYIGDMYMNITDVIALTGGLDSVVEADIHYDLSLVEDSESSSDSGVVGSDWQQAFLNQAYGRLFAVVQFIRYDTVKDQTTYKQIVHDIAPDKIVLNDLYDTGEGYTGNTDLLYDARQYFNVEHGLDTTMIIGTGNVNGVSVVENGLEVIYKTKVVGVYGYLESSSLVSKYSYKVSNGDLYVCDDYSDLQSIIVEQSQQSISDFENNVQTATGEILDTVGSGVAGLINMLTGLLASVGQVPLLIDSLFVFIPLEIRMTMYGIIAVIIIVAIIKSLP